MTSAEATAATSAHEPVPSRAIAYILSARFSAWSGSNFITSQIIFAVGLAFAFNASVGSIVLELINTGDVLTQYGQFVIAPAPTA